MSMVRSRRRKRVFSEINITPLTDVCLVLLIIFMVTATSLVQTTGLSVDLPRTDAAKNLPARSIEVTVTRDGAAYVDGEGVSKPELSRALEAKLSQTSSRTVLIRADADVPYRHVADAMGAAGSLNAEITLAADAQETIQKGQ